MEANEADGRTYLFYSIAGEEGIAGAEVTVTMKDGNTPPAPATQIIGPEGAGRTVLGE